MIDANTYYINRHLAGIEAYDAEQQRRLEENGPWCEECGEACEDLNENDLCDDCNQPSPADIARMRSLYEGEKRAGLLKTPEEIETELKDAGRK